MSTETASPAAEGPQVTFVGGRAIEQHETSESQVDPDVREDAMEEVRKAIKAAGEDSAEDAKSDRAKDPFKPAGTKRSKPEEVERGADGKFLPKEGAKKEEEEEVFEPESASLKQLLKNREKLANLKKNAKDEISLARQAFEQERQQFAQQQQAMQRQMAQIELERKRFQRLRDNPAEAVRDIGYDPEKFILDLAQDGTPEGRQRKQYEELQAQVREMNEWKQQQLQQQKDWQERQQQQFYQNQRQAAVTTFVKLAADEEKYPHVATFYKGRERALVAEGDLTAEEYRTLSGGKEGSYEDILDYIEDQLAERANGWYSKKVGNQKVSVTEPKGKPSQSKGKSLSPEQSGERRTLRQKDLRDLDAEERLEAAKQAVGIALAHSKNADD